MRTDAPGVMHVLHIPRRLPPDRFRKWCERRTRLDVVRARRKGKTLSAPNRRRLLARRLAAGPA